MVRISLVKDQTLSTVFPSAGGGGVGRSAAGTSVGASAGGTSAGASVGAALAHAPSIIEAISKIEKTNNRRFISFFSPWNLGQVIEERLAVRDLSFTSLFWLKRMRALSILSKFLLPILV